MHSNPPFWVNKRNSEAPLRVTNRCEEEIYPGVQTQSGTGPLQSGFRLAPGDSVLQSVSADWQGRVWGRTNCSFNAQGTAPANNAPGQACSTGDCGGAVDCQGAGQPPASLAEFTLESGSKQTFYDISLVDGYNIPMALISLRDIAIKDKTSIDDNDDAWDEIPPNLTNPICIGTSSLLEPANTISKSDPKSFEAGTNETYPLPLEEILDSSTVSSWCPWDLQLSPPVRPGDGVYPYPDQTITRPTFQACYSACAKWADPKHCCTGRFSSPATCQPSQYSDQAKKVCPDAYSYAFDDQASTFIIPSGGGFEVVFCPRGRSTTILSTLREEVNELAQGGKVTERIRDKARRVGLDKTDLGVG